MDVVRAAIVVEVVAGVVKGMAAFVEPLPSDTFTLTVAVAATPIESAAVY